MSCCGKTICDGCIYAMDMSEGGKDLCPFCRTLNATSNKEHTRRTRKLMDNCNGEAYYLLGCNYSMGAHGMTRDYQKANELWLKAGELGSANGYYNLGVLYKNGHGVEIDQEKAKYYYELAAMGGHIMARNNLGCLEARAGNLQRAMKHWMISANAGDEESLDPVKQGFKRGLVTKDDFANTLRSYHERQKEMKSEMRDKAAAARRNDEYLEMV